MRELRRLASSEDKPLALREDRGMTGHDPLVRGRAAFDRESWAEAYTRLVEADRDTPLEPDDLDALATVAHLTGEDAASRDAWTRAHTGHLTRGDVERAALSALWLALVLLEEPDKHAVANGWLSRVARLLDQCPSECAAQGRWLCATAFASIGRGDVATATHGFEEAARIGRVCGDADLAALAGQGHGRVLLRQQRTAEGLAALDEAMVAVTCGEVGPIVSGVVYCSVIGACQEVFDLRRAHEWTTALAGWCAAHPDMVPFRGPCLVRRSELLQLRGDWHESVEEAERACERTTHGLAKRDAGLAQYRLGDLRRLRGEFDAAEAAYRFADLAGRKPDPGLALLRLATGHVPAAVAAIRRAIETMSSPRVRVDVQRAAVEILLAAGDTAGAADAAADLGRAAGRLDAAFLRAAAEMAAAAVALARGELDPAFASLRIASALWDEIDAPYERGRARALTGDAYLARGDEDGARMEFEAAQELFERLGASPDAARMTERLARWGVRPSGGLTGREVEVLRLVATGRGNRAIAADLAISEKTVARHISNIFTKLDLPSRSAATAYAYEHKLL